jgi:uncharacterized peroxidase-related enzyme
MKHFSVPTREQVSPESQSLFEMYQKRMGKVPNLYATMGYSPVALKAFMGLEDTLNAGVFHAKEREAIALVVSEVNGCAYCLAGHTALAIKRGFTKEETLDIRRGQVPDLHLNAIVQLAKAITETKGYVDEVTLDNFFQAGFDERALMELIGLVTVRIFTNYVYAITQVPVDFPPAEALNK